MKQKNTLILDDEFLQYCKLNNITDINKLAKDTFNNGFTILKYGDSPFYKNQTKEIIKEVEKIVEVIKEVPVEVIKEVIVEKKSKVKKVDNTSELNSLSEENAKLKKELEDIKKSITNMSKAKYMKNSNLSSLYDE